MKLFPPSVTIDDDEGFATEKDIFQRAEFGRGLMNLVSASDDPLVIMLDSPWGTGKTTFIKMWAGELRKNGFPVIAFDAFENDHIDNGFMAIAAEVIQFSNSQNKSKTSAHKTFVRRAARAGGILLRTSAKIGVKAATLGAIDAADLDALTAVADDITKEASTKADKYMETVLKLQSQEHETLASLRHSLSNLVSAFSEASKDNDSENQSVKPLIFIIDELDRCRPNFALELLEKIKHIFSIEKVHFVLAVNLPQLENSVRFSFGREIDAKDYLQKFYSLVTHFPERGNSRFDRTIPKYVSYLSKSMNFKTDDLSLVQNIAEARRLSLRAIERIVTCISISRQFTPENYLWLDPIITGLSVMKVLDVDLFHRARLGTLGIEEVKVALGTDKWPEDSSGSDWTLSWWIYCLAEKEEDHPDLDWKGYKQTFFRYAIRDRKDIVRLMAGYIDRFQLPTS